MPIVQSYGALQQVGVQPRDSGGSASLLASPYTAATYSAIYRSQPEVRTVIEFFSRNIAQLAVHAFRRVSDTDRIRLADHEVADWIAHPNPDTTGYRLIDALCQDVGIHGVGYWLKVRLASRLGLVRLPPSDVTVEGYLLPKGFVWTRADGETFTLAARDVCYFRLYNPDDPIGGLSPLETLRPLLCEHAAASTYRRAYWQNAARLEGVITRPLGAPKWTPEQKQSFREQWQARYAGQPGQTAVLEDGMEFTPTSYSARESEFTQSRKLTREEVAAAYHVPLPMVGILDHATFSNIREQHKQLYQDCLGPWLEMLQQEFERQLLPESDDAERVYLEFNIADKLKGSFEEQAAALQTLVGRPVMTPNEGRARLNLPSIQDDPTANTIALPLNMAGGTGDELPAEARDEVARIISATWDRQRARLDKIDPADRATTFGKNVARWDRELTADLERAGIGVHRAMRLASSINGDTLQLLVTREDAFSAVREAALYV